jgi:hypothetical protein
MRIWHHLRILSRILTETSTDHAKWLFWTAPDDLDGPFRFSIHFHFVFSYDSRRSYANLLDFLFGPKTNPETFSTDFDSCDRLYFDELSYERIMDIYELENSSGVVVSVGGQLSQNAALRLQESGKAKVLGTNPVDIGWYRFSFAHLSMSLGASGCSAGG